MFIVRESIDETLEVVKVVDALNGDLPDHDELFNEVSAAVDEAAAAEEDSPDEADEPEGSEDDTPPEGSHASEESTDLRATEVDASEGFTDLVIYAASGVYSGLKSLAQFAGNVVLWTAHQAKELGIAYGPVIYAKMKSGTVKIIGSTFNLLLKFRLSLASSVKKYVYSVGRMKSKYASLSASLAKLESATTLPTDPAAEVMAPKLRRGCYIAGEMNPLKAAIALKEMVSEFIIALDRGMEADVRTIELLIENTSRGIRFSPFPYLETHIQSVSFAQRKLAGFSVDESIQETYAYKKPLPGYCLPVISIPKREIIKEATETKDISQVTRAYHGSYIVLAVDGLENERSGNLHYMDKQDLRKLLAVLGETIKMLDTHLAVFKSSARRSERLKLGYTHYLHWLDANEEQKGLKQDLLDVIHLKQHFVTRVYLPAMMDLYEFSANHTLTMLSYVQQSIKKIKVDKNPHAL